MAASPSADWKAAASEAPCAPRVGGRRRGWRGASSTRSGGCVLPLITRRAVGAAVGGGRDVEGDAAPPASDQAAVVVHSMAATVLAPSSCGGRSAAAQS
eukprot:scaffold136277_cov66-Phaeocystis_antarctica.AAC.2